MFAAPASNLQISSPEHELRRLLALEGLPEPVAVEPVYFTDLGEQKVSWSSFHRTRSFGAGRRAGNVGYGFRIEFEEAVRGPIAVGYGEHFGMGMFEADKAIPYPDEVRHSKDWANVNYDRLSDVSGISCLKSI